MTIKKAQTRVKTSLRRSILSTSYANPFELT